MNTLMAGYGVQEADLDAQLAEIEAQETEKAALEIKPIPTSDPAANAGVAAKTAETETTATISDAPVDAKKGPERVAVPA